MTHIPIVLCSDRNVIPGLLVAITSAIENLNKAYSIKCYILAVNLGMEEKSFICNSLSPLLIRLEISFIDINKDLLQGLCTYGRFTSAVYGRYFAAELIPEERFLVYIDTDIIIQRDLSLLPIKMDDNVMAAAVAESTIGKFISEDLINQYHLKKTAPYINTGFILINAQYWREYQISSRLIKLTKEVGSKTRFVDQDIFNIAFGQECWLYLDSAWNKLVVLNPYRPVSLPSHNVNIHTVEKYKPWMFKKSRSRGVVQEFYRYLWLLTVPWVDCPGSYIHYENFLSRAYGRFLRGCKFIS